MMRQMHLTLRSASLILFRRRLQQHHSATSVPVPAPPSKFSAIQACRSMTVSSQLIVVALCLLPDVLLAHFTIHGPPA